MERFLAQSPCSSRPGSAMSQSEEEEAPKPATSSQGRQPDITHANSLPPIFQYLTNFYGPSKTKGKVKCKICLKEISYSTISNYNIKSHYQKLHHSELPNLVAALSRGSKRGRYTSGDSDTSPALKKRQASREAIFKPKFDPMKALKLYYSFFIKNVVPYHLTDSGALREFIQYLNPEFKVPSKRKMTLDIAQLWEEAKVAISTLLANIFYVGTTADSWSAQHQSYLGMTVHWIDPVSLNRKKAVLGIKEVIVQQKAQYLARAVMDLHREFGLTNKVISTTTDNGKNYVAAFEMFAGNVGDEEKVVQELVQEGEALLTTIQVEEALKVEGEEDMDIHRELPKHRRCGAHTVNLMATTDVSKVPGWNSGLRRPFTKTASKAQALWNAQNRRAVAVNQIKEAVGKKLHTPGVMLWNSYYESCAVLLEVLEDPEKKDQLNVIIQQQGLMPFYEGDKDLLAQYCKIMKPVANCLDILQTEKNAFMGFLLPNLKLMRDQLVALQSDASIEEGQELIKYLLENPTNSQVAFRGRFEHLFADMDLLMATALHPHFKLPVVGYLNEDLKETIRRRVIGEVLIKVAPGDDSDSATQEQEEVEKDPFQYMKGDDNQPPAPGNLEEDLKKAFDGWNKVMVKRTTPLSVDLFPQQHREAWVDLFIKYNTPVPSSAAVERLFSLGSDVLRPKRLSLTDDNFEKLVFVNGNLHLLKGKSLCPRKEEDNKD